MSLGLVIKQHALDIGFDLAGIAPLAAWKDLEFSRQWVERGMGGEMRYLKNPKRDDPRKILPSAKTVICLGLIYNTPNPYSTEVRQMNSKCQEAESSRQNSAGSMGAAEASDSHRGAGLDASFQFPVSRIDPGVPPPSAGPWAWISRYAWGRDYHHVMRSKLDRLRTEVETLAPGAETHIYVDTGPVVERAFARLSGIGWMGRNTCLINERKGSWFFLAVMLTSLELEPDLPAPDRCGSCTRCLDACPTGALVEPYIMDASRCIAYFTIELKGSIPTQFRSPIGVNIFGCDICQDVCPWNSSQGGQNRSNQPQGISPQPRKVASTRVAHFEPLELPRKCRTSVTCCEPNQSYSLFNPPLEELASLSDEEFRRIFAHSPIKRSKYRGWLRNLCVAMGNSGDRRFVPWLERAREHPDSKVREHATWALERLHSQAEAICEQRLQRDCY